MVNSWPAIVLAALLITAAAGLYRGSLSSRQGGRDLLVGLGSLSLLLAGVSLVPVGYLADPGLAVAALPVQVGLFGVGLLCYLGAVLLVAVG
jgi:hypothetical protein